MTTSTNNISISFLEKILINLGLPLDLPYHVLKSKILHDKYSDQEISERARAMWDGKIAKYGKLLRIKAKHNGGIPYQIARVCTKTPCGYVRYIIASCRTDIGRIEEITESLI